MVAFGLVTCFFLVSVCPLLFIEYLGFTAADCVDGLLCSSHEALLGCFSFIVIAWNSTVIVFGGLAGGTIIQGCCIEVIRGVSPLGGRWAYRELEAEMIGASPLGGHWTWSREMSSATYPRGGRGLEVDSGVGIRLGLASDLTPVPINQKVNQFYSTLTCSLPWMGILWPVILRPALAPFVSLELRSLSTFCLLKRSKFAPDIFPPSILTIPSCHVATAEDPFLWQLYWSRPLVNNHALSFHWCDRAAGARDSNSPMPAQATDSAAMELESKCLKMSDYLWWILQTHFYTLQVLAQTHQQPRERQGKNNKHLTKDHSSIAIFLHLFSDWLGTLSWPHQSNQRQHGGLVLGMGNPAWTFEVSRLI